MPTREKPDKKLIKLFLSAYEEDSWQNCKPEWQEDWIPRPLNPVEVIAIRQADGFKLAIEHTLIQPYGEYKKHFALLEQEGFTAIISDPSIIIPNRSTTIFVAPDDLAKGRDLSAICKSVHDWLRVNIATIPIGKSNHAVSTPDGRGCKLLLCVLGRHGSGAPISKEAWDFEGQVRIGIDGAQLPDDSLAAAVEKALETKLRKLTNPNLQVDKRILLLERNDSKLLERRILELIEQRRPAFSNLYQVNEIWFAETVFGDQSPDFSLFDSKGEKTASLSFTNGSLQFRTPVNS